MRRVLAALLFICAGSFAHAQTQVNCATGVPCTTTGPAGSNTGDPAWLAFGKINTNTSALWAANNAAAHTVQCNATGGIAFATACNALPAVDASAVTVLATGTTNPRALSDIANDEASICQYAAAGAPCGDARTPTVAVTTTAGLTAATISGIGQSFADGVAHIVIPGAGIPGAASLTDVAAGTGYAEGDTFTVNGGTCSIQPVGEVVQATTGGVTTAVPITAGSCTVPPVGTLTTTALTGGGSGATVTATWLGAPFQTTITSIVGSAVTLGAAPASAIPGTSTTILYCHDDAPAIQAALNSGATYVKHPQGRQYCQFSQLSPSGTHRTVWDFRGTSLNAAAAISGDQILIPVTVGNGGTSTSGSGIENHTLNGWGLLTGSNIQNNGNYWTIYPGAYRNPTFSYIRTTTGAGSWEIGGKGFSDSGVLQIPPLHILYTDTNDQHFVGGFVGSDSTGDGVYDASGGNFYVDTHVFKIAAGDDFSFGGNTRASNLYPDGIAAGHAALHWRGNNNSSTGMHTKILGTYIDQIGVLADASTTGNVAVASVMNGITTPANGCVDNGSPGANVFAANSGCSYSTISATTHGSYTINNGTGVASGATTYFVPGTSSAATSTFAIVAYAGTLKNLYVKTQTAPSSATSYVVTVYSGAPGSLAASALTCTVAAATTSCNDVTHSAALTASQAWTVQIVSTSTGSSGNLSIALGFED